MSRALHAKRDALLDCAIENGGVTRGTRSSTSTAQRERSRTTRSSAKNSATLHVLEDGEAFQLGRSPRLFGAHAYVSRLGVAVHVNAFNFPRGASQKKRRARSSRGCPCVSKPATSTALLSFRIVEIFVAEEILPEGALSFIAGSTGNLLELLDGQDVLAFTGSSYTGATLRGGNPSSRTTSA